LYGYKYEITTIENYINGEIKKGTLSSVDLETYMNVNSHIARTMQTSLDYLIESHNVYQTVQYVEEHVCRQGMQWMNNLITSYTWLNLIILLSAVAINRLKPLVEKKKLELDVFIF
jgi:hypothetical protein